MNRGTGSRINGTSPPVREPRAVRIEELGELIRAKRRIDGLTLGAVARLTGVSPSTLSRLERQIDEVPSGAGEKTGSIPDTRTLAAVTRWLGVALERVVDVDGPPPIGGVVHHEGETVPEMVEAHLRADRNLDQATASALARTFRVAYEQFARLSTASPEIDSTTHAEETEDA